MLTDCASAQGALSATATFYSATCIVLYMHRCCKLNYHTVTTRYHAFHQQDSIQPISLMSTGTELWSTNFDYHQSCWWHRVFLHQCTIVDVDHCGGQTQIFDRKASEADTSQPVEKCNFCLPHLHLASPLGWSHRNFVETFCTIKLESPGYCVALFLSSYI